MQDYVTFFEKSVVSMNSQFVMEMFYHCLLLRMKTLIKILIKILRLNDNKEKMPIYGEYITNSMWNDISLNSNIEK